MPAEIRELEEHEMPEPVLLTKEERQKTRTLYQTVFSEDSQKFVDFYYEYKIRDNQIYALWEDEQYVSTVSYTHLDVYKRQAYAHSKGKYGSGGEPVHRCQCGN